MCGEVVIKQFEANNTIDTELLSKFANFMSEQSVKIVVDMILRFTKNKFTQLCGLPEQVLHHILQRDDIDCEEVEIFKYLRQQQSNQTEASQITAGLFAKIRYFLIPPQYLLIEATKCDLIDKQQVHKAIEDIHTSCAALGENGGGDYKSFGQYPRMPNYSLKIDWCIPAGTTEQVSISCTSDEYNVQFSLNKGYLCDILYSRHLKNGIYSFVITYSRYSWNEDIISLKIIGSGKLLSTIPLPSRSIITMNIHDGYLFLKVIDGGSEQHSVKSTITFHSKPPIFFKIIKYTNSEYESGIAQHTYYFNIIPAHIFKLKYCSWVYYI